MTDIFIVVKFVLRVIHRPHSEIDTKHFLAFFAYYSDFNLCLANWIFNKGNRMFQGET